MRDAEQIWKKILTAKSKAAMLVLDKRVMLFASSLGARSPWKAGLSSRRIWRLPRTSLALFLDILPKKSTETGFP